MIVVVSVAVVCQLITLFLCGRAIVKVMDRAEAKIGEAMELAANIVEAELRNARGEDE